MQFWVVFLLLLPSLIDADWGDCDEEREQIEREKEIDKERFGCRSCHDTFSISAEACPDKGYECDPTWPMSITPNVLAPDFSCSYARAKCAGNARVAVDRQTFSAKFRCNNSQWTANGEVFDNMVCAKPCGKNVCEKRYPNHSPDFVELGVSDAVEGCAIGVCDPKNGMTAIKENDGTADKPFPANSVTCTSDGKWKGASSTWKYVMCNASPCGPTKCPAFKSGPGISNDLEPLKVQGNGVKCATAKCPEGLTMVEVTSGGDAGNPLTGVSELTCTEQALWQTSQVGSPPLPFVMCQKKPQCKLYIKGGIDKCEAQEQMQDCEEPTELTPTEIICPQDYNIIFLSGPSGTEQFVAEEFTCNSNGKWESDIGRTPNEALDEIACGKAK